MKTYIRILHERQLLEDMFVTLSYFLMLPLNNIVWHTHLFHLCLVQRLDDLVAEAIHSFQGLGHIWDCKANVSESDPRFRVIAARCIRNIGVGRNMVEFE